MYESFFQLTKSPFSLVSDPGCIYLAPSTKHVIRNLVHGVLERRGCLALTADPGLGKTTVLRALSEYLVESNARSSTIATPTITAAEFLELLMLNFGIEDIPPSKARRLKLLEEFLIRSDEADTVSALIVDEAHKLSDEVLEEIRLLGNFESGSQKLLQIVLAGQTELDDRLNRSGLWQLKQRITTRLTLARLTREQIGGYIRFRWSDASATPVPFTDPALGAIAAWSQGIPRTINVICHNALQIAFMKSSRAVDAEIIHKACAELDLAEPPPGVEWEVTTQPSDAPEPELEPEPPVEHQPAAETENVSSADEPKPKSIWRQLWRRDDSRPRASKRAKTSILSLNEPRDPE
jgi:general secretion pathway protein A